VVPTAGYGHLAFPTLYSRDDPVYTSSMAGERTLKIIAFFVFSAQQQKAQLRRIAINHDEIGFKTGCP